MQEGMLENNVFSAFLSLLNGILKTIEFFAGHFSMREMREVADGNG